MHFEEIPYIGELSATTKISVATSRQKSVPLSRVRPEIAAAVRSVSGQKLVDKPTMAIPSSATAPEAPVRSSTPPTTMMKTPGGSIPVRPAVTEPTSDARRIVERLVPTGTNFPTGKWTTPLRAPTATAPSLFPPKGEDGAYRIPDAVPTQFTAETAASSSELTTSQSNYATSAEGARGADADSPFLTQEENAAMKQVGAPVRRPRGFALLLAGGVAAYVYWKFYAKG